jgi:hypothetical protein
MNGVAQSHAVPTDFTRKSEALREGTGSVTGMLIVCDYEAKRMKRKRYIMVNEAISVRKVELISVI